MSSGTNFADTGFGGAQVATMSRLACSAAIAARCSFSARSAATFLARAGSSTLSAARRYIGFLRASKIALVFLDVAKAEHNLDDGRVARKELAFGAGNRSRQKRDENSVPLALSSAMGATPPLTDRPHFSVTRGALANMQGRGFRSSSTASCRGLPRDDRNAGDSGQAPWCRIGVQ